MLKIVAIERAGETGVAGDTVRLDYDQRARRRMVFRTEGGKSILLDMARPIGVRDGDAFRLEDGSRVAVAATAEALMEIGAASVSALVRIAWHLGNRHLPTQLVPGVDADHGGTLRIRHDHVIAEMVVGLGGTCVPILAPFDPEGGAYAGGGGHAHGHSHDHEGADDHDHHHHEHQHG